MNNKKTFLGVTVMLFIITFLLGTACSVKRPVLYPNEHLNQVGKEVAQSDINDCINKANDYVGKHETEKKVAKDTAFDAATGAAAGAVSGNAGIGAATGAAGGGALGCVVGIFGLRDPDPLYREFVEHC